MLIKVDEPDFVHKTLTIVCECQEELDILAAILLAIPGRSLLIQELGCARQ